MKIQANSVTKIKRKKKNYEGTFLLLPDVDVAVLICLSLKAGFH